MGWVGGAGAALKADIFNDIGLQHKQIQGVLPASQGGHIIRNTYKIGGLCRPVV